ncbi:MAG: integrase [Chloroflexi bacterium]|nr:MAG: integrase [Chloroflexota bacterium]
MVFTNEKGGPLSGDWLNKHFQALLRKAGVDPMPIHGLRHGAGSLMAALGIAPRVAMELLGHSQISVTMNIYSHVAPQYAREAADVIGNELFGT